MKKIELADFKTVPLNPMTNDNYVDEDEQPIKKIKSKGKARGYLNVNKLLLGSNKIGVEFNDD